jgi:hypothetical protein
MLTETSPAAVNCFETKALLAGKMIKFKKLEYAGWDSPIYYFDLEEPAAAYGKHTLINEIDAKLKPVFPLYKLLDYGIMPLTTPESKSNN